jgi:hypothetical protein
MSWNVAEYIRPHSPAERRAPLVEEAIREIAPQVLLVQELYAAGPAEASDRARALADATGLTCELPDGSAAVAYWRSRHAQRGPVDAAEGVAGCRHLAPVRGAGTAVAHDGRRCRGDGQR